ncbi:MAG TPA: lytic transglycosylase domain-containing protein [Spirochaetota bacterium]|nr:lytic transglycosylase domain-containing protein [Spirochaetota bacterium]
MIEEMYNAMTRITELKNRFGLNKVEKQVKPQGELNATFGEMTDRAIRLLPSEEERLLSGTEVSRTDIENLINYYSNKRNIPPSLVRSVITAESGFDPNATSPKGAMGLMQLMPSTVMDLGVENPYDPEDNIKGGTALLKNLLDNYQGDYKRALAAYNAGKGTVDKAGGVPDIKETKDYVRKVIDLYAGEKDK